MEYTGTEAQSKFVDGIFDLLINTGLAKEGRDYMKAGHSYVWNDKLHDIISDTGLNILAAIDE